MMRNGDRRLARGRAFGPSAARRVAASDGDNPDTEAGFDITIAMYRLHKRGQHQQARASHRRNVRPSG